MSATQYPITFSVQERVEAVPLLPHPHDDTIRLDLSHLAQSTDEKLPAIIITPCVPSSPLDYEIAFLASQKDEYYIDESNAWSYLRYPATGLLNLGRRSSRRSRVALCLALPIAVIGAHLLVNHIAARLDGDGTGPWPYSFWS